MLAVLIAACACCALLASLTDPVRLLCWEFPRCRAAVRHLSSRLARAPAGARVRLSEPWLNAQPRCVRAAVARWMRDNGYRRLGDGSFMLERAFRKG